MEEVVVVVLEGMNCEEMMMSNGDDQECEQRW